MYCYAQPANLRTSTVFVLINYNRELKVNEFIVSLSEFFNSQGEDSSSLDMLDIYKGTILESIARE